MADAYELLLSANLPSDLSDPEIAELRWHLGLGPEPAELALVTDFQELVIGDDGEPEVDEHGAFVMSHQPYQLLAEKGVAWHIGGVLLSEMQRSTDNTTSRRSDEWVLTTRQEMHPDELDHRLEHLLLWLSERAISPAHLQCHLRFHEDLEFDRVTIEDGKVIWP